jgi:hypothetical protein
MTDMPYPIVRIEAGPAHDALVKRLCDLGVRIDGANRADRPYVCLIKFGDYADLAYADDEEIVAHPLSNVPKYWGGPMILLNSPAQMIRYTERLMKERS